MVVTLAPVHPERAWSYRDHTAPEEVSMGHPVTHFEIHGQDRQRLYEFYQQVFGWSIDSNNPMGYGLVSTNPDGAGIGGGIMAGVGTRGVTVYVQTDDIRMTLDAAVAHGAEVV